MLQISNGSEILAQERGFHCHSFCVNQVGFSVELRATNKCLHHQLDILKLALFHCIL